MISLLAFKRTVLKVTAYFFLILSECEKAVCSLFYFRKCLTSSKVDKARYSKNIRHYNISFSKWRYCPRKLTKAFKRLDDIAYWLLDIPAWALRGCSAISCLEAWASEIAWKLCAGAAWRAGRDARAPLIAQASPPRRAAPRPRLHRDARSPPLHISSPHQ